MSRKPVKGLYNGLVGKVRDKIITVACKWSTIWIRVDQVTIRPNLELAKVKWWLLVCQSTWIVFQESFKIFNNKILSNNKEALKLVSAIAYICRTIMNNNSKS